MPQNTPMKRQFITIDGRTVMSNLPQHWGGNDWKITGVDNPLPVGNYVQTESGVWIPQKGSGDGAADVRITGSLVELYRIENVTVSPGSLAFGYAQTVGIRYDFDEIRFSFLADKEHNFSAQVHFRDLLGGTTNVGTIYKVEGNASGFRGTITEKIELPRYSFAFYNLGTEDVQYRYIQFLGVRK